MDFGLSGLKMMAEITDVTAGLVKASPIQAYGAALNSLETVSDHKAEKREKVKNALKSVSLEELKRLLQKHLVELNENAVILISSEFTRRGIAPAFRGVPVRNSDPFWRDISLIDAFPLLVADIEWLTDRYPNHKTKWARVQQAFQPEKREKTAEWLLNGGDREAGQIAIALGLDVAQQRELAYAQFPKVQRWVDLQYKKLPVAEMQIRSSVDDHPWKTKSSKEDTVKRRRIIWLCSQLADKKPQRAADFYRMMTGEEITRQAIHKQMRQLPEKVRRASSNFSTI